MQLLRYRPAPPLDRYIECFWWSHREAPQVHSEHMLPSGGAQLLFALHEIPILCHPSARGKPIAWSGSIVHGPQSSYYVAGAKPKGGAVGISFHPGAAGTVLGTSMAELVDRHVPLDAIWGTRGVDLHQRLLSAAAPQEMFRILEQSLSARIHRPLLIHPAVAHALTSCPDAASPVRVADIQRASGYSPRHFIALFRSAIGLNPKHYYRIRRFNSAARSIAAADGQGLSDIAAAAGDSKITPSSIETEDVMSDIHEVYPYLRVHSAAEAIDFYARAFGAKELFRLTEPSGRIGHAEIKIGPATLMLADEHPEHGIRGPRTLGGTTFSMHLHVENVDSAFERAVKAGATVIRPLKDQFYGERSGTVLDPFGHEWLLGGHLEDVSTEEMQRRYTQLFKK